jgi:hypothetical protein
MSTAASRPGPIRRLVEGVASIEDWVVVRTTFFAMLAGTAAVLYIDYTELNDVAALGVVPDQPVLPAFDPDSPDTPPGPAVTTDRALLDAPLTVALKSGGILEVTGTIDLGSSERFAAEVEARGEYIEVVALNSPGGSVNDAIAIGSLIREKGYTTSVATGALCASSCPLILASGAKRVVEREAAVGVHQIYARVALGDLPTGVKAAGEAMSDAQKTTAVITRHLGAMGVDPALWLHALETPPTRLYYLSPEEMAEYHLTTE